MAKGKLELTWVGKENRPRLEPRVLVEDPTLSYGDPNAENMLIHGDNLLALKALEQDFAGKIKCVYIDPPYNTGAAFEHYDDGIEHSLWLSMIRDRLELLRRLLRQDGVIFCSIDGTEMFYLGILFDEVFGRDNKIETVVWQKSYGGGNKSRYFVNQHEFILAYAKEIARLDRFFLPPDEAALKYYKFRDEYVESRGPYRLQPLATTSMDDRPNLRYPILSDDGEEIWPEKQWQWSEERVKEVRAQGGIVITKKKGKWIVSYKQYLRDEEGVEREAKPKSIITGIYTQHGTYESVDLFGQGDKFDFPKPERLIWQLIESCTEPGEWVLDSFLGSGTTAAVAHKMSRRWIACELGDHCYSHCVPRLRNVVSGKDPGGITEAVGWAGGGGFKFYRLAESLLVKDKDLSTKRKPVYIINPKYDATMLVRAICKIENFRYLKNGRWHGASSEHHFLHVTTSLLTQRHLDALTADLGPDDALLLYCTRRVTGLKVPDNIEVRKIPRDLLEKCSFEEEQV